MDFYNKKLLADRNKVYSDRVKVRPITAGWPQRLPSKGQRQGLLFKAVNQTRQILTPT